MKHLLFSFIIINLSGASVFTLTFLVTCIYEREKRASVFAGLFLSGSIFCTITFFILKAKGFFHTELGIQILLTGNIGLALGFYIFFRKTQINQTALKGTAGYFEGEIKKVDQREIVFARQQLQPDSIQYKNFYSEHPHLEEVDDYRRGMTPGLFLPAYIDSPYEKPNIAIRTSSRHLTNTLSRLEVCRPKIAASKKKIELNPEENTIRVKGLARQLGASLVGICKINSFWVYSHKGMIKQGDWEIWGEPIDISHPYAVIIATEMSWKTLWSAPHQPASLEGGIQYAKTAFIGVHLAAFIANLGFEAESNHSGNYNVCFPPLAIDAGLGELSRMGYVISKELGPRMRLAAVTTDLPLIPDKPIDIGVEDFCTICNKCSVCCPAGAIPNGDHKTVVNGIRRWKLDAESCYGYWGKTGSSCSICMRVCPWGHPKTFPHRIVTEMSSRNKWARRILSPMDDVFYSRKPKPVRGPLWAKYW